MVDEKNNSAGRLVSGGLAVAAVLGLGLAFAEALYFKPLPAASVAEVNGVAISKNEYQHVLLVVGQGRKRALSEPEKAELLERMIDNELLLQRAQDLGLAQSHPEMRRALVQAQIEFILDNAETPEADEGTLRDFYIKHKAWFQISERLQVRQLFWQTKNKAAAKRAVAALKRGVAWDKIKSDSLIQPPRTPVPTETLSQYLGQELLAAARLLAKGETSGLIVQSNGFFILRVEEKLPARSAPFEKVRVQVEEQYRRYQSEVALQDYIKNLRSQAKIKIAP